MIAYGTASVGEIIWTLGSLSGICLALLLLRFWNSRQPANENERQIKRGHIWRKIGYLVGHLLFLVLGILAMQAPPRQHTDQSGQYLPMVGAVAIIYIQAFMQADMLVSYRRYRRIERSRRATEVQS